MIVKTAVTSSALKVLSTLFGIRIQIKLKPNLNTYQIKLYGDGFDITLAMDKDKEEKFQRKCTRNESDFFLKIYT